MYVDSHCHLDCIDLAIEHNNDIAQLINEARQAQVSHMLCVCIELEELPAIQAIAERFDDISFSVGIHPNVELKQEPTDAVLLEPAKHPKCIAIGETGLDYFRSQGPLDWQRERFVQHIRISNQTQKPLIVHMRDASDDTLHLLQQQSAHAGVMHCFAEDWSVAKKCLDLGMYISFSGIVSFKNAKALHDVAKKVPSDRFLIETDSPYLAPTPYRGKQNRPAWVVHVAEAVAVLRNTSLEQVAQQSTQNFYGLFSDAVER